MSAEPIDLQLPQQPVILQEAPAQEKSRLGIADLLGHLATTARERAAGADLTAEQRSQFEEVARLASELAAALAAVRGLTPEAGKQP